MPKGQKICPKCTKAWGPRKILCGCGHEFKIIHNEEKLQKKIEKNKTKVKDKTILYGYNLIFTPKGKPPIKFKGDILDWIEKMRSHKLTGYGCPMYFARQAIEYFIRNFFKDNREQAIITLYKTMDEYEQEKANIPTRWGTKSCITITDNSWVKR